MTPIPRSYLFVPATRPDRFEKALASGAHAVIADLEDAVPPPEKSAARQALKNLPPGMIVRVNAVETEWFREDTAACGQCAAIVLPKTETPDHVLTAAGQCSAQTALLPLIETARGIANAVEIARCPCVQRLVFGHLDLQLDLGVSDDELLFFRSTIVLASRLAGLLPPIDGITTAIDSLDLIRADTERAIRLGFGGKLCIHPRQIPIVNECFRPRAAEIAWAEEIVEAARRSAGGPILVRGKMVDRPVITRAERILSEASRAMS
ncbi:MAG TPA: CoA ester lyase [Bryobacteraceae bacterium]|nr:CoA ester lyase [Bryobacteraceae bacterium]